MCVRLDPPLRDPSSSYSSHTPSLSPLPLPPASSPPLIQPLTQSEFYQATWDVINSPIGHVRHHRWGPIEDWDTSGVTTFQGVFSVGRQENGNDHGNNPDVATFNGDISKWDTSSVTELYGTFDGAKAFNGDLGKWITSNVKSMSYTFRGATSFTGTGVDLWNINKMEMRKMFRIFEGANENEPSNALTSCSKRKIADAWKNNAAFNTTLGCVGGWSCSGTAPPGCRNRVCGCTDNCTTYITYITDWAADKCTPCVAGTTFSASGNAPCTTCAAASSCATGVKTACITTTDTVCKVSTVSLLLVYLIKEHFLWKLK